MTKKKQKNPVRNRLYTSILLVLLAFVAVTAATVAWFSIADRAKVKTMSMDIIADSDLRMDLDPHKSIEQYVKTLSFEQIAERIQEGKRFLHGNNTSGAGDNVRPAELYIRRWKKRTGYQRCISGIYPALYGSERYDRASDKCQQRIRCRRRNCGDVRK